MNQTMTISMAMPQDVDVDLDAELLRWLYRVAVKVHHDIKISPNHDCIGKISKASAEEIVPESLIMLISQLCTGYQEEFQESQDDMDSGYMPRYNISFF